MSLSDSQKLILKTELQKPEYQKFGQDYPAIAAHLNAQTFIANSNLQGTVQKTYNIQELFQLLQPDEQITMLELSSEVFSQWASNQFKISGYNASSDLLKLLKALLTGVQGNKPFLEAITNLVQLQQKPILLALANVLLASGVITQATYDAISTYANLTVPDPIYQAQIPSQSIAQSLGIPLVQDWEVQEILN